MRRRAAGSILPLLLLSCSDAWYLPTQFVTMELTYAEVGVAADAFRGGLSIDLENLTIEGHAADTADTIACNGNEPLTQVQAEELRSLVAATEIYPNGRYETSAENPPTQILSVDGEGYDVLPGRGTEYFLHTGRCALMEYLYELFPVADRDLCPTALERMFNCEDQGKSP